MLITPTRREFVRAIGGLVAAVTLPPGAATPAQANAPGGARRPWYAAAWRRAVIDMHIPDFDEAFLSKFDPAQYVDRLVESRAQSIVLYAHSHVGLFNYPTNVGRQHAAWKGRDAFGDLLARCRAKGIAVQAYASVIFDRFAATEHPDWRPVDVNGNPLGVGRFGMVCPNNAGYRDYVKRWAGELCERYDVDGVRFDMTFWPTVCFCPSCAKRFADEAGGELPRKMDWLEGRWVTFQRAREAWLADFAALCTSTVKARRPNATVEHQASSLSGSWTMGGTAALAAQNDFLQGDFYGDALQGSFVRKLLSGLTPNRPFAFETSYAVSLDNHTTPKPEPLLDAKASAAIADGAAFVFIDAIDPVGTVNPRAHATMGRVFERLTPYYEHLGGERVADAAIYYSFESKFSFHGNPRPAGADAGDTHTPAAMQAARWLLEAHLPFTVITKQDLPRLREFKVLVLANVNAMDDQEAEAITAWVRGGGGLYASGSTSLVDKRGRQRDDFMLAEVFGASLRTADWTPHVHYLAPTPVGQPFFPDHDATYPPMDRGFRMHVDAHAGAEVLATSSLPWPANERGDFSSIHSNPPWVATDRPILVAHRYRRGRSIYCASLLEQVAGGGGTFVALIRSLCSDWRVEADAPAAIEVSTFHQPDRHRYVVSLLNFQKELPNIPVHDIPVRLRPGKGQHVRRVVRLPDGAVVPHADADGAVTFVVPRLQTLAMFAVEVDDAPPRGAERTEQ